jgi:hypothetical protein
MADPKPVATMEAITSSVDGSIIVRQTTGSNVLDTKLPENANNRFDLFYQLMQTFVALYSDPTKYKLKTDDASTYHYQIGAYPVTS